MDPNDLSYLVPDGRKLSKEESSALDIVIAGPEPIQRLWTISTTAAIPVHVRCWALSLLFVGSIADHHFTRHEKLPEWLGLEVREMNQLTECHKLICDHDAKLVVTGQLARDLMDHAWILLIWALDGHSRGGLSHCFYRKDLLNNVLRTCLTLAPLTSQRDNLLDIFQQDWEEGAKIFWEFVNDQRVALWVRRATLRRFLELGPKSLPKKFSFFHGMGANTQGLNGTLRFAQLCFRNGGQGHELAHQELLLWFYRNKQLKRLAGLCHWDEPNLEMLWQVDVDAFVATLDYVLNHSYNDNLFEEHSTMGVKTPEELPNAFLYRMRSLVLYEPMASALLPLIDELIAIVVDHDEAARLRTLQFNLDEASKASELNNTSQRSHAAILTLIPGNQPEKP